MIVIVTMVISIMTTTKCPALFSEPLWHGTRYDIVNGVSIYIVCIEATTNGINVIIQSESPLVFSNFLSSQVSHCVRLLVCILIKRKRQTILKLHVISY